MNRPLKRLTALFLALLCAVPFMLSAATPWTYVDSIYDYEDNGDYNGAMSAIQKVIENESYFTDPNVVAAAKAKLKHYGNEMRLYTETDKYQSYLGALHEPSKGVRLSTCTATPYDFDTAILCYGDLPGMLGIARRDGKALLYAMNVNGEGSGIRNTDFTSEAEYVANLANSYSDVQIFVRFGAEMNIWTDMCTPNEYIAAFRKVSGIIKGKCKNVAMVWGLNYVSHSGVNYMDYYPGDEYVDWVGMCFYADMHQGGTVYTGDQAFLNNICDTMYYKGPAADPVIPLRELCDIFHSRKPVMITECGASYKVNFGNAVGEDTRLYALSAMRKIYEYVPMVCPEVKMIAHFNSNRPGEIGCYSLKGTPGLESLYKELATRKHFVTDISKADDAVAYAELEDGFTVYESKLPVSTYIKNYAVYEPCAEYYIDGALVAVSDTIPYRKTLDLSSLSNGNHTLKVVSAYNGKLLQEKTWNFTLAVPKIGDKINDVLATDIKAYINGVPVKSYNIAGNTAVLAEELAGYGFSVAWNGSDRTLSISKGSGRVTASFTPEAQTKPSGTPVMDVLFTDIKTYVNGAPVQSFNVGGSTIIFIDALSPFGTVSWNQSTRSISFVFD